MPELSFQIEGAEAVAYAAAPLLAFKLRVSNAPADEAIHTVVLRAQIQIDVTRRRYTPEEQEKLVDLFGDPGRWGQTLRNMLWTHANVVVPGFTGETLVELPVPCTFRFQCRRNEILSRPRRRRSAFDFSLQRDGVLSG